jgi:Ca2+-dependent lipid-binding protein
MNNNLNPEWDQIVYVPVHSLKERLILELMDYQNIGKDRTLGTVLLDVAEYAQASGDQKYPYTSKGSQMREDPIRLDKSKSYKGSLHYEVSFRSAVSLRGGVSFDAQENEFEVAAKEQLKVDGDGDGDIETLVDEVAGEVSQEMHPRESKAGGELTAAEDPEEGVVMTREQLLVNRE